MRLLAAALLIPAGCGGEPKIECAVGGGAFERACTLERSGDQALTVRHADGGFRRIRIENGEPTAADGAERATVTRSGEMVEVAIGRDRYRLPAEALR
jgi:hypothetical protein